MESGESRLYELTFFSKRPRDGGEDPDDDDQKHRKARERKRGARGLGFRGECGEGSIKRRPPAGDETDDAQAEPAGGDPRNGVSF